MHYPVRKRGEARRLNPNYPGIHWLERESQGETELLGSDEYDPWNNGLKILRARGYYKARHNGYPRRMFDLFGPDYTSAYNVEYWFPCPACDDWARTSRCADHPDEGIETSLVRAQRFREFRDRVDQREIQLAALQIRAERRAERD